MRYYHRGINDETYNFILYDTFWHVCRAEDDECFPPKYDYMTAHRTMDGFILYGLIAATFAAAFFAIALPLIRMQANFHARRLLRTFAVLLLLTGCK